MVKTIAFKDTGLVNASGAPIIREVMEERIAAATLTGVRQAVGPVVSGGLDPWGLASLLIEAQDGEPWHYFQLAEEIEEKYFQYMAVLGQRKRQVSQLDITLEAGGKDPIDVAIAQDVQNNLVDSGLIANALFDMLDAIGKGHSLMEIVWNLQGAHWAVDALDYVDPRFIRFDRPTRRIPLLRGEDDGGIGMPLPPYKFLWLPLKAKSGIPVRGGLARPVAWAWLFQNFALKDWVQFCEIYGIPFRYGEYQPGAAEDDKDALLRAVASISADGAAIIPSNMKIVFQEGGSKGASGDVHSALTDYLDKQISKLVLGQTGTADSTAGQLGGKTEHNMVREDIERSDANALTVTLNRDLVVPYCFLNYGPRPKYPTIRVGRTEAKDTAIMIDAVAKLVPIGFRVKQDDIRSAVGFDTPQPGDEIFAAPVAQPNGPPPSGIPNGDLNIDLSTRAKMEVFVREIMASQRPAPDAIERATTHATAEWKEVMGPAVDQILAAAAHSTSFEMFMSHVKALYPSIDMTPLAKKLASLTFQAYAGGAAGHVVEPRPISQLASAAPYGDVEYADPGYQADKKKRYPIDTEEHIRAAWDYIDKADNQSAYTADQLAHVRSKIVAAWKKKIDPAGPPSSAEAT